MIKTFLELLEADAVVGKLYKKQPELKESKFDYAWSRFHSKNIEPTIKAYQEAVLDVRIQNALEDSVTKAILTDSQNIRGFKFSKDGLKKTIEAERKLSDEFDTKEIEVEPFMCATIPDMSEEDKTLLDGLIFKI